jgi:hypothetical protein
MQLRGCGFQLNPNIGHSSGSQRRTRKRHLEIQNENEFKRRGFETNLVVVGILIQYTQVQQLVVLLQMRQHRETVTKSIDGLGTKPSLRMASRLPRTALARLLSDMHSSLSSRAGLRGYVSTPPCDPTYYDTWGKQCFQEAKQKFTYQSLIWTTTPLKRLPRASSYN